MMKKAIIIIARNENEWPEITATNFQHQFSDCELVGIDDGGNNVWPPNINLYKTIGGVGVGMSRRYGVEMTDAELIMVTDGHVLYDRGDKEKIWRLAEQGFVVTFTTKSLKTGKTHGNGRTHMLPDHKAVNTRVPDGHQIGLIGSVYAMKRSVALDVIAPTSSHGFNEQVMTVAALAFGHDIYSCPDIVFSHLYKNTFNYDVTYNGQQRNRKLLDWWFLDGAKPHNISKEESRYMQHVQLNRKRNKNQIIECIEAMNRKELKCKMQQI